MDTCRGLEGVGNWPLQWGMKSLEESCFEGYSLFEIKKTKIQLKNWNLIVEVFKKFNIKENYEILHKTSDHLKKNLKKHTRKSKLRKEFAKKKKNLT